MKQLLFTIIGISSSLFITAQDREEFDNLVFFIPPGLTTTKTINNMVLTDESAGNGQYFTITVNKSTFSLKNIEKSFPESWRESLLNDGVDNPVPEPAFAKASTNSGWNCLRGGKAVQYNVQQPAFYYHLTIMRHVGITLRIVTRASSEDLFMQKYPMLVQLISSVGFKGQSPGQTNNQSFSSNQVNYGTQNNNSVDQSYHQSVQLNTLYVAVQGDLLSNGTLSVLCFLPGGNVFTDIPEKGFSNFRIEDQKAKSPNLCGTYTSGNNTIAVRMNNQTDASNYIIQRDGSIMSNDGSLFKKIELLDNYQFEGTYINKQDAAPGSKTITFTKDGHFTDNGLVKTIVPSGNTSSGGKGNYASKQNSISLQYSDGHQLQLCFYMMPEDYQQTGQPGKILVNNYILVRQ